MNGSSGRSAAGEAGPVAAAEPAVPQLTLEEEAALLARYGTKGPYDDGLEWAAPSLFKSQMGDGHVFLTGTAPEDDDDDGVGNEAVDVDLCRHGRAAASRCGRDHAHKDPFRLYLHENFPSLLLLDKRTPVALMETVTGALDALEKQIDADGLQMGRGALETSTPSPNGFMRSPTLERHAAVLRSGKEWVRRASLAVQGASLTALASHMLVPETNETPLACHGELSPMKMASISGCPEDVEFHRLVESTEKLLAEATETLKACSADACDDEAENIVQAIRAQQERETYFAEDPLDLYFDKMDVLNGDDDEKEVGHLLRCAREGRARLRASLALRTEDTASSEIGEGYAELERRSSAEDVDADAAPLLVTTLGLPYLYAFEMELPRSRPLHERDGAALQAKEENPRISNSARAVPEVEDLATSSTTEEEKSVSLPQLLTKNMEVLAMIANTGVRDAQMELDAAASREAHMRAHRPETAARRGLAQAQLRNEDRAALGFAILPSFVKQLDTLLSPTREEKQYRSEAAPTPSVEPDTHADLCDGANSGQQQECRDGGSAVDSVSRVNTSLARIRRQAALESFLVEREASEGHRMRLEDELVERENRAAAELLVWYAEQRTRLEESAVQAAENLCETQRTAYGELLAAANKDKALAQQSQKLRRLQETEKLVYTLLIEWEVQREKLLQEEALSFRLLCCDGEEEEQRARLATHKRVDGEVAAARKAIEQLRIAFEQQRVAPGPRTLHGVGDVPADGTAVSLAEKTLRDSPWYAGRIVPLLRERATLLRWMVTHEKSLQTVRTLLEEAEGNYRAHVKGAPQSLNNSDTLASVVVLPENPPLVEERRLPTGHTTAGARILDADAFVRLLWPSLHAVVHNPRQAPHHLARLVLSLENLQEVSWGQLRHLRLNAAQGERTQRELEPAVAVTHVVKELDLSGNPLKRFNVLEAARTFSSLQSLKVSHAQLQTLDASGGTAATCEAHATGSSDQKRLSGDKGVPSHSSHLRHVTAARNHALAAQVHLLSLDVSSNSLSSLTPLSTIASSSLVRCTATENQLPALDSLSGCVQLRELSAAHNRLTDVGAVSTMPLLREMDVGNNEVGFLTGKAGVGGDDAASSSPMLLSKLYASHNPLRALPTSQYMYLFLTQLFVNHTKLTSLYAATLGWFPMLTVLQAEGNGITDISGVQHCPRLRSLKLSHNRLASLSVLEPLRCCTRLQVLDLTGNPCLAVDSKNVQCAATVTRALYELVPSLELLNNFPREHTREPHRMPESHSTSTAVSAAERGEGDSRGWGWHTHAALASLVTPPSRYVPATPQLYREVFSALCWDAQVQHLLEEKELREAYAQRPLNRAKGWELTAADAATAAAGVALGAESDHFNSERHRGATVIADLNAVTAAQVHVRTAEHQRHMEQYRIDAAAVSEWIDLSHRSRLAGLSVSAEGDSLANTHVLNFTYKQKQEDHVAQLARAYLAEWLHGRVQIRRARLELARLRLSHRQCQARRLEIAVRRIQPVWRGAALRSRLRRFLHPERAGKGEETDDNDFPKVNVDDWLVGNNAALAPVEVLFHDVVESARDLVPVPFDVTEIPASGAVPAPRVSTTFTPVPPRNAQSHDGVVSVECAPQRISNKRPSSDVAGVSTCKGGSSTLVEEWGPLVAAQIRKKQQKFARSHQQHMRKEFLEDPLRVKRETRENRAQQRPK